MAVLSVCAVCESVTQHHFQHSTSLWITSWMTVLCAGLQITSEWVAKAGKQRVSLALLSCLISLYVVCQDNGDRACVFVFMWLDLTKAVRALAWRNECKWHGERIPGRREFSMCACSTWLRHFQQVTWMWITSTATLGTRFANHEWVTAWTWITTSATVLSV